MAEKKQVGNSYFSTVLRMFANDFKSTMYFGLGITNKFRVGEFTSMETSNMRIDYIFRRRNSHFQKKVCCGRLLIKEENHKGVTFHIERR